MKKIFLALFLISITNASYATQMCARKDTTVIPLDGFVAGKTTAGSANHSKEEWIWYVDFEYGRLHGIATCLSYADIAEIEGVDVNSKPSPSVLSTNSDKLQGRSEYYNGDPSDPLNERGHCYCKLTHPMSSCWILERNWGSHTTCFNDCAFRCREITQLNPDKRKLLFRSIW
ncbi:MAG: hypothetical protein R8N24_01990 [Alphaproteobacteria bacterium]|nr:hypothetical protein [Alphaproteobacteria bacterium]